MDASKNHSFFLWSKTGCGIYELILKMVVWPVPSRSPRQVWSWYWRLEILETDVSFRISSARLWSLIFRALSNHFHLEFSKCYFLSRQPIQRDEGKVPAEIGLIPLVGEHIWNSGSKEIGHANLDVIVSHQGRNSATYSNFLSKQFFLHLPVCLLCENGSLLFERSPLLSQVSKVWCISLILTPFPVSYRSNASFVVSPNDIEFFLT